MKTITSHLKAIPLVLLSVLSAPLFGEVSQASTASTAGIAIDRTEYFTQAAATGAVPLPTNPFSFNFNIRGTAQNMTNWGPAFYKPGSGGVAQTGTSSATNTGTLNFSATPNNSGGGFMFSHDFATNADLVAAYPLGAYGVNFTGTGKPTAPQTDNPFTAGLAFAASGATYPSVTPQITNANNGALWYSGGLKLSPSGVTTMTLNAFPEYSSSTYGSVITAGIYGPDGSVISSASVEAYYLPTLGVNQPAVTQLTLDGAWLTPGVNYTLEIQYVIIASAPQEGYLNNENFQGVSSYIKNTSVNVSLQGAATAGSHDFNSDGQSDIVLENTATGDRAVWLMNGTTIASSSLLGSIPTSWRMAASGDFNADGQNDIVLENTTTGDRALWIMNGTTVTSSALLGSIPTNWRIAAAADFNADGKCDIVLENTATGDRVLWIMDGTTVTSSLLLGSIPTSWRIAAAADFNGDGKPDIVLENTANGDRALWYMNGTTIASSSLLGSIPTSWRIATTGDFNSDGQTDIVLENSATGDRVLWIMNGSTITSSALLGSIPTTWRIVP
jgi:hypothetical protein